MNDGCAFKSLALSILSAGLIGHNVQLFHQSDETPNIISIFLAPSIGLSALCLDML